MNGFHEDILPQCGRVTCVRSNENECVSNTKSFVSFSTSAHKRRLSSRSWIGVCIFLVHVLRCECWLLFLQWAPWITSCVPKACQRTWMMPNCTPCFLRPPWLLCHARRTSRRGKVVSSLPVLFKAQMGRTRRQSAFSPSYNMVRPMVCSRSPPSVDRVWW